MQTKTVNGQVDARIDLELSPSDIVASLQNNQNVMQAPERVEYRGLKPGEAVAQGEYAVQYLGRSTPEYLATTRNQLLEGTIPIGSSSHSIVTSGDCRSWSEDIDNPLVMEIIQLLPGGSFFLSDNEHAFPQFTDEGFYLVRVSRDGAVADTNLTRAPVRLRVD